MISFTVGALERVRARFTSLGFESRWVSFIIRFVAVRRGSHQGGSPQNGLGDERTCGTTLASAYVLRHLSAAWSQLQMKERESEGK